MIEISDVVNKYLMQVSDIPGKRVSYQSFANMVNVYLHPRHRHGWAHWRKVAKGNYQPGFYEMWYLAEFGQGWVRDFATELVALLES